jgi:hypothetical protein
MKPVKFKEANGQLVGPDGSNIQPLPCYRDGTWVISRWKPTLWERVKIMFGGKLTLWIMGGQTQPPCLLTTQAPQIITQDSINAEVQAALARQVKNL